MTMKRIPSGLVHNRVGFAALDVGGAEFELPARPPQAVSWFGQVIDAS
jgi:hypothetical protein